MKKALFLSLLLVMATACLFAKSKQVSDSALNFSNETKVSLAIPMRFYTWITIPYSKNVTKDLTSGIFDFTYEKDGGYLVRGIKTESGIMSFWGNQVLLQDERLRCFLVTAFIGASYAQVNGNDGIDAAFDVLKQIFTDENYTQYREQMIDVIKIGLDRYAEGGEAWESYKKDHFLFSEGVLSIRQ